MNNVYILVISYDIKTTEEIEHDLGSNYKYEGETGIDFFANKEFNNFNLNYESIKSFFIKEITDIFEDNNFADMIWDRLELAVNGFPPSLTLSFGEEFQDRNIEMKEYYEGFFYGARMKSDGSGSSEDLVYLPRLDDGIYNSEDDGYTYTYFGIIADSDTKAVINRLKKSFTRHNV